MNKIDRHFIRKAVDSAELTDGGEGSGNHNHAGRPGQVGGSAPSGTSAGNTNAAWNKKVKDQRNEVLAKKPNEQAYFVFKQGFVSKEQGLEAMRNGTADRLVNEYFDIMERNGDPTPTKPVYKERELLDIMNARINSGEYEDDYVGARVKMIQEVTGQDEQEADRTERQFNMWFGGLWSKADRAVLDKYIEQDGVQEGTIYRGLKFSPAGYDKFMSEVAVGAKIDMKGCNSSWTTDEEAAELFHGYNMEGRRAVRLECVKNKTASPVEHLSTEGECEVIAHSRAQWTVLRIEEGDRYTNITVVEAGDYAPERAVTRWQLEEQGGRATDAMPDKRVSLWERMAEQSANIRVVPDSLKFAKELADKYGVKHEQD